MKMYKKLLSLLLACGMTLSLLAGCGQTDTKISSQASDTVKEEESSASAGQTETSAQETKGITFPLEEPVTFTAVVVTNNEHVLEEALVMEKMEELTNVHWEFTYIPLSEYKEKVSLLLNSGNYPDVFIKSAISNTQIETGVFLPLEDLIPEYAPNFAALMDERSGWSKITSSDGHIYTTAEVGQNKYMQPSLYINLEWLENLGLEMPTTLDEFYNVLVAFKEQDADGDGDPNNEIPWNTSTASNGMYNIANYFNINRSAMNSDPWAINEAGDEIYFWPASDVGKEIMAFITKCYSEGLMNSDAFINTQEQMYAVNQSEAVGCFTTWSVKGYISAPDEYDIILPFEGTKFPMRSGVTAGVYAITDACEYPEIALAWIDYFYTDEIANLAMLGEEGVTYSVEEDGSWNWITDGEYGEDPKAIASIHQGGGVSLPTVYTDYYLFEQYRDPEDIASVRQGAANKLIAEEYVMDKPFPTLTFTEEEKEINTPIIVDLDSCWQQYLAQVATGEKDLDATWEEYLAEMEEIGLSVVEDNYNAALDRLQ